MRRAPLLAVTPAFVTSAGATVRAEGLSELVGEIALLFPSSLEGPLLRCRIEVFLNTEITNGDDRHGASLIAANGENGNYSTHAAHAIERNGVYFEGVLVDLRGAVGTRQCKIIGIRAKVAPLGLCGGSPIYAYVRVVSEPGTVHVMNPQTNVARLEPGCGFDVHVSERPPSLDPFHLRVRFREGYPGAFAERNTTLPSSPIHNGESTTSPQRHNVRLVLRLTDLPPDTTVLVTRLNLDWYFGRQNYGELIEANENGPYPQVSAAIAVREQRTVAVPVIDGNAQIEWIWRDEDQVPRYSRSAVFGIIVMHPTLRKLSCQVQGGLGPMADATTLQAPIPEPRFLCCGAVRTVEISLT